MRSLESHSLRKHHRYSITTEIQPPSKFLVSVALSHRRSPSKVVVEGCAAVEGCAVFLEVSLVAFHLFIALVNKFDFWLPVSGQGSGRRWTLEKDLSQLKEHVKGSFDDHECLYLTEEIAKEVDRVVFKIRAVGRKIIGNTKVVEMQNTITLF
ncbi:hypothetical protein DEO72_LG8g1263 [Vigna unguiculata]|uniref:Uncharacterized protein n=1 Tax=Vigna unguiculata TaxID=3917 RepID=A0A4D6MT21_VIGUN|nr:hypothetical protein DEO72_LG8g1263 [Vigna unguiculata]